MYGTNRAYWMVAVVVVVAVIAWLVLPSVEEKQLKACVEDIKLGLNDPDSLEVLSTETRGGEDGPYYLVVDVTARNRFGGRDRGSVTCGFKSKDATELDPEELQNQLRDMQRTFEKAGIRFP